MSNVAQIVLGFYLVLIFSPLLIDAKSDEKECEVCIATIETFRQQLPDKLHNESILETDFRHFCKNLPIGGKEYRFCYFVGATEDAATGTINNLIRPLSYGVPSNKICHQLKAKDSQVCELRFDVKPDYTQLNKMKVGQLRKILSMWDESLACAGCAERADFVKVVRELMPTHEPEEWKKLQAAEKAEL